MSKRKLSDHNVRWDFVGKHPAKRPFSHVLRAQWSRRARRIVGIPVTRLIQPAFGFRPVHAERVELRQLMQKSFLWERQRRPFCRRSEELAGEAEDSSPSGSVADP